MGNVYERLGILGWYGGPFTHFSLRPQQPYGGTRKASVMRPQRMPSPYEEINRELCFAIIAPRAIRGSTSYKRPKDEKTNTIPISIFGFERAAESGPPCKSPIAFYLPFNIGHRYNGSQAQKPLGGPPPVATISRRPTQPGWENSRGIVEKRKVAQLGQLPPISKYCNGVWANHCIIVRIVGF